MAQRYKIFRLELTGAVCDKFDDLHSRTNILTNGYMSELEMLIEIFKLGIAQYEDSVEEMEREEFHVC